MEVSRRNEPVIDEGYERLILAANYLSATELHLYTAEDLQALPPVELEQKLAAVDEGLAEMAERRRRRRAHDGLDAVPPPRPSGAAALGAACLAGLAHNPEI